MRNNFPNNELILWSDGEKTIFEENKHYLCIRAVPHFSVEPPNIVEKSWRYAPVISKKDALRLYNDPTHRRPYLYWNRATVQPMFPKNCKVSYLNVEQLSDPYTCEFIKRYLTDNIDIYDYSLSNIKILGRGRYLPYRITNEETEYLKKCLQATKKYDVCVVGTIYSEGATRRIEKINELKRHDITVLVLDDTYEKERDRQIGEARILVNIHFYTHWKVYEAVRCERWRAAGMPIISEVSIDTLPDGIIGVPYEKIVETVIATLAKMKSHWR
jgi:hypothetical protein